MMRRSQRLTTGWAFLGALPLLLLGAGAFAGPSTPKAKPASAPKAKPASGPKAKPASAKTPTATPVSGGGGKADVGVDYSAAATAQSQINQAVDTLDSLDKNANAETKPCVSDKANKGKIVQNNAAGDAAVVKDAAAPANEKGLAVGKLQAGATVAKGLVTEAKGCKNNNSPDETDDKTANNLNTAGQAGPPADATVGGAKPAAPTAGNPTIPQTAGTPSI